MFLNDQIMDQVFKKFHSEEMKEKTDAIAFMQEIFNISKNFQLNIKMTIVGQLKESCDKFKIFEFMNECIKFYKKERAEPTLDKQVVNEMVSSALETFMNYITIMATTSIPRKFLDYQGD